MKGLLRMGSGLEPNGLPHPHVSDVSFGNDDLRDAAVGRSVGVPTGRPALGNVRQEPADDSTVGNDRDRFAGVRVDKRMVESCPVAVHFHGSINEAPAAVLVL